MKKFFKKLGKGLLGVGKWLITWGKPLIRSQIKNELVPMLQKKVNAGAVDKHADKLIKDVADEFCKKL
jgi:hypothetical protein